MENLDDDQVASYLHYYDIRVEESPTSCPGCAKGPSQQRHFDMTFLPYCNESRQRICKHEQHGDRNFTRECLLRFYVGDKIGTGTDTIPLFKIRRTCPGYMSAYECTTTEKEWIKWFLDSYIKVGTIVLDLLTFRQARNAVRNSGTTIRHYTFASGNWKTYALVASWPPYVKQIQTAVLIQSWL
jgi:hypothetical protein